MKVRLLIALIFLSCSIAMAAPPQNHQYIVKLRYLYQQPNASAAAPLKDVVTHGGGHVDYEGLDRLVVTLPDNAVEAIAKHSATKYMQLVRTGPPTPRAATQTISMTSVNGCAPPAVARALSAPLRPLPTSSSTWDSGTYAYDGAGNITGIGTDSFTYDSLSRLTSSSIKGNTETYTYDQFGNLTYKTTHPAQGSALPVDLTTSTATNHLSGQPYDTAGNLTGTAGTELNIYDPFNMLREKDISSNSSREFYLYNANDERIAVISNPCGVTPPNCSGALITVSGRDEDGHVLRQFDLPYQQFATPSAPWLWLEDYVYRDGLLLAADREAAEGGRRHFHLDHLGSPRLVTGDGGAHIATHDYYPFGVEITSMRQETLAGFDREDPMKFTGHERDLNIGTLTENSNYNDYMHARSTVPQWGRFLSVDPMLGDPRSPQSWNRYTYSGNNPINRTDPTGRCEQKEGTEPCSDAEITVTAKNPSDEEHYLFLQFETKETDLPFMGDWSSAHLFPNELWSSYETKQQEKVAGHPVNPGEGAVLIGMALVGGPESAANSLRLNNQLTAEELAAGHAFGKHVIQQGEFPGVATRSEFAAQIEQSLNNASEVKYLSGGRVAYWDDATQTVVIRNPNAVDGGTAFRPKQGRSYFDNLR